MVEEAGLPANQPREDYGPFYAFQLQKVGDQNAPIINNNPALDEDQAAILNRFEPE